MHPRSVFVALAASVFVFASSVRAQTITIGFRGVVQTVGNDQNGVLAGRVVEGSPFTGDFTFRADTSDAEADPAIGIYQSESPTGMSLSVGTLSTIARADGLRIRVRNNIGAEEEDDVEVIHLPPPPAVEGIGIDEVRLLLRTRDTALFPSDALPTALPNPVQNAPSMACWS